MLDNLPPDYSYIPFKHPDALKEDGTSSRLRLVLTDLHHIPSSKKNFWKETLSVWQSSELKTTLLKKFYETIEERFPENKWDSISLEVLPSLFRDLSDYKIRIHPDNGKKTIVLQVYLPPDNSTPEIGTCFHNKVDDSFNKADQIPFRRNYGYAFPVTNHSWHSVDTIQEGIVRNSLMLIYSLPKGATIKDNKIHKKKEQDY